MEIGTITFAEPEPRPGDESGGRAEIMAGRGSFIESFPLMRAKVARRADADAA